MKTPMAKGGEITPRWYLVDAEKEILGRAATKIARMLMGKHRPTYTPHIDTGDFIVVINANGAFDKLRALVTGRSAYRY